MCVDGCICATLLLSLNVCYVGYHGHRQTAVIEIAHISAASIGSEIQTV